MKLSIGKRYLLKNNKTKELYIVEILDDEVLPIKLVYDLESKKNFKGQRFSTIQEGDEFIEITDIEDIIHLLI